MTFVALFRGDDAGPAVADRLLEAGWPLRDGGHMPVQAPVPWHGLGERVSPASLHGLDPLAPLIGAHAHTGEAQYLRRALEVALDWIGAHPAGVDSAARVWRDLPAGRRGHRMAYVLSACEKHGVGAVADRARLHRTLEDHLGRLAADGKMAASATWGAEQIFGQISIAAQLPALDGAAAARSQGQQRLADLLGVRVAGDAGPLEHGPGPVHELLVPTQRLIDGGVITDAAVLSAVVRAREGLAWLTTPGGRLALVGETGPGLRLPGPPHPAMQLAGVRVFPESGWWVIRGEPPRASYVVACAGFHSTRHKHADDLALLWQEGADVVLADPGRYGRGPRSEPGSELRRNGFRYAAPERIYVESTHAHSTVEIDGATDVRTGSRVYGSAVRRTADHRDVHAVELEARRGSVQHRRTVVVKPGVFVVVCDTLTGGRDSIHDYTCHWQLGAKVVVDGVDPHPVLALPSGRRVDLMCVVGGAAYRTLRGEHTPRLAGWCSPRAGELTPATVVAVDAPETVRRHTFVTILTVCSEGATPLPGMCRANATGRRIRVGWQADEQAHQVDLVAEGEALELRYRQPATDG